MNPSRYDLLGVETDASSERIRAAWKASIADLDPTDRRFRIFNQAAEVLLDPAGRAAYDEALVVEVALRGDVLRSPRDEGVSKGTSALETSQEDSATQPMSVDEPDRGFEARKLAPQPAAGSPIAGWALAAVASLAALMVALAGWLATQPSDSAVADATTEAQSAAEAAAETILSYDFRSMDEDRAAAGALMTADYRKEYDRLFSALEGDAAEVKIQVSTELVASGIERAHADRVTVLVFVNRPTLNASLTEPVVYRDQVTMTMEKDGDQWLVDGMETTPVGA